VITRARPGPTDADGAGKFDFVSGCIKAPLKGLLSYWVAGLILVAAGSALAAPGSSLAIHIPDLAHQEQSWISCSSSHGGCSEVLIRAIRMTHKSIIVHAPDPGPGVVHALCSDMQRGIRVEVVSEDSACNTTGGSKGEAQVQCNPAYSAGVPQMMIIDDRIVVRSFFGSTPTVVGTPAMIDHVSMVIDRVSALAYSRLWRPHARPLGSEYCEQMHLMGGPNAPR